MSGQTETHANQEGKAMPDRQAKQDFAQHHPPEAEIPRRRQQAASAV